MSEPSSANAGDSYGLQDMVRIMDVASALRKERESVERAFNREVTREQLRERLLASAKVTGEQLSPEEVDAAIEQYYDRLYTFAEPPRGLRVMLARAYIRRGQIAKFAAVVVGIGIVLWLVWFLF
jgi:hypothetical protein